MIRQPATLMEKIAVQLATCFGVGNAAVAPGTWGSIPGVALGLTFAALSRQLFSDETLRFAVVTFFLVVGTLLALWCIHVTEKVWNTHDEGRIVADEVIGQAIALAYLNPSWQVALLGFGLFRWLDITKPWLIGWLDRSAPGALGTLGDDVLAGVFAALVLGGLQLWVPNLML